jgi:hypothetical protein
VTDVRFSFEALQHDHGDKPFPLATDGPSLARQEIAEECDIEVLLAYGRCLRPALYSSLRSSPSHPTGVSALRVTIAIASARFARKPCAASRVYCRRRGGFFAIDPPPTDVRRCRMIHLNGLPCILSKSPRTPRLCWPGSWSLGTSDQRGQDKTRKVCAVGWLKNGSNFNHIPNVARYEANPAMPANALSSLDFRYPASQK